MGKKSAFVVFKAKKYSAPFGKVKNMHGYPLCKLIN